MYRAFVVFWCGASTLPRCQSEGGHWDYEAEAALRQLEDTGSRLSGFVDTPEMIMRRGDGVIYAMGGSRDFVAQEVLPTVRYLQQLGAKPASIQYALFTERRLLDGLAVDESRLLHGWFDRIIKYEEVALPSFRRDSALSHVRVRVKGIKAHAFLFAPFERFVFLDFDSRPCTPDFGLRLIGELRRRRVDALLHNQWVELQERLWGEAHYAVEHNSAIAVFDSTTPASDAVLRFFVSAFEIMKPRRDQPPLMVALRAAKRAANFTHADIPTTVFCRRNASTVVSCDAGCLVVHKPQKYDPGHVIFGIGSPGTERALPDILAALKIKNRPDVTCADAPADNSLSCRVFIGSRVAANFDALARQWPRAKFVLTISKNPSPKERDHNLNVVRRLDPSRLFVLDIQSAFENSEMWKRLCSFLEVWSSCKTTALSKIAHSWLSQHMPESQTLRQL